MENIPLFLFGAGYFVIGLGVPAAMVVAQLVLAWPALRETRPIDTGRRTAAGAAQRGRRPHQAALRRGVRAAHRRDVLRAR